MTQYEMTEQLAGKCDVTLEEAKEALEQAGWNPRTATHRLEQEKFTRMQALREFAESGEAAAVQAAPEEAPAEENIVKLEVSKAEEAGEAQAEEVPARPARRCHGQGFRNLAGHIRRLLAWGNRNRFTASKGDETVLDMPVLALALLLLCAFWVTVPLLVIGLFTGFRFGFTGQDLGREGINRALDKAADAADRVKQGAVRA